MKITHENAVIGNEYFTADGECFKLAALLPDEIFAGYRAYVTGDGETAFLEYIDTTSRLFSKPPTQRFHKDIEALKTSISEYAKTKAQLAKEIDVKLAEHKRLHTLLSSNKASANLALFLEKKITHVAVGDYSDGWHITELKDLQVFDHGGRHEGMKLLCLFGKTNGDLLWKVNEWQDGSGSWSATLPATSKEDAESQVRSHIAGQLAELSKNNPSVDKGCEISAQVVLALKWQIDVAGSLMEIHQEYQSRQRQNQYIELKNQLARITEAITNLENQS